MFGNRNSDAEYTCKHNPLIKQFILNMSNIHPTYAMYYEILWPCLISVKRRIINNFPSMTIYCWQYSKNNRSIHIVQLITFLFENSNRNMHNLKNIFYKKKTQKTPTKKPKK